MMIKATDIDYLKTATVTYNTCENYSLTTPSAQSIIDVIADDIESTLTQVSKVVESMIFSVNHNAAATPGLSKNLIDVTNPYVQIDSPCKRNQKYSSNYIDLDTQDEEEKQLDYVLSLEYSGSNNANAM
ncbi:10662_t:CDS:2 [Racocetra persica]|uniref:10662_t:CDS:1 n=1 Tax=Racocetra persica TaxID=160502 RepID=A0ACA9KBW0_9GLOM|nr:10662_t:CDS:2 [Racocetra persica]